jgi:glyoxylase-like metal-dependent hydrolase (beta-lactamase superfamily II)
MIHEIFPVGPLQCNCSVIGDEGSHEAMVVDPGDEIERVLELLRRHGLKLKMIAVTHGHIDHIGGAGKLHKATGAPVYMNEADQMQIKLLPLQAAWIGMRPPGEVKIDHALGDADKLTVGDLSATVLHTPGHTEGSVCLYFDAQKKLVAGDTLFAGSIGRTDLPGGNFEKIMRSLQQRVLALPDETVVVPGHGPLTSIGEERQSNPFLTGKLSG